MAWSTRCSRVPFPRRKAKTPMAKDPQGKQRACSMCGQRETSKTPLIEDPSGQPLCRSCVSNARDLLNVMCEMFEGPQGAKAPAPEAPPSRRSAAAPASASAPAASGKAPHVVKVPKPKDIKGFLDQYVVGQEHTKRALAVAVHNHYKRIWCEVQGGATDPAFKDVEIEKSNILLIGPTGCGKTLLARTLARMLDVPFAIADATTLTEAGYVGEDVENILLNLLQAADMDVERAQTGIIFVDEIDKIGRKTENVSITRDVSGEGVQQALLKILEGTVARVPPGGGRKHPQQTYIEIQTQNILFICGGAFVGLEDIIQKRIGASSVGFGADIKGRKERRLGELLAAVQPEDLLKYGLIPEFIGRLPVIATLEELDENDLMRVLVEPKDSISKQYQKILELENVKLKFTDGALRAVSRLAVNRKAGARGLRAILENTMLDIMYDIPSRRDVKEVVINEDVVKKGEKPILLFESKTETA